jgi:hypothetical protein
LPLCVLAAAFALLASSGRAQAPERGVARTGPGLVIVGSILPKFTLLPAMTQIGSLDHPTSGPDLVEGFARDGSRLFATPFSDAGYTYYLFAPVPRERIERLYRLRVQVRGKRLTAQATVHGAAQAQATALDANRAEVRWNPAAFPRLACIDEAGGSPAPLMLGGSFTGANFFGKALRCDFSDGVKTAFRNVRIPIAGR